MTRRDILTTGAAALSALTLTTESSAAPTDHAFFHVFVFRWKPQATEADKQRAIKEIKAFQGVVPGLQWVHVGNNASPKNKDWSFGGIMQFTDKAKYDAYPTLPVHQALLKWLLPLIEAIELDLPA